MSETKATAAIHLIDTYFCNRPNFCSNFLIKHGSKASFIDCSTYLAVPRLLKGLSDAGCSPNDVEHIIPTHAHLDHCGGTFELLKHCPNATVFAHPKAIAQMENPEKLKKGTIEVYGEENFKERYGLIEPIDPQRMKAVKHGEILKLENDAELQLYHSPGHASHHIVVFETSNRAIFTGDTFGVAMGRGVLRKFIAPTASPVDFNAKQMLDSINMIGDLKPKAAYLAHYGIYEDIPEALPQLRLGVQKFGEISDYCKERLKTGEISPNDENLRNYVETQLSTFFLEIGAKLGFCKNPETYNQFLEILNIDMNLNIEGIIIAAYREIQREIKKTGKKTRNGEEKNVEGLFTGKALKV